MAGNRPKPWIRSGTFAGRRAISISNGKVRATVLPGGGHIVELVRVDRDGVNPYWIPPWPSIEPSAFRADRDLDRYGGGAEARLLASIMGHNLCLDLFGGPSDDEAAAGLTVHGEAPVVSWKVARRSATAAAARLTLSARLPIADLEVSREIVLRAGADGIRVRERVRNLARRDRPLLWTQHVTVGPPFLERGVTVVDLPAGWGQVYPDEFGRRPRLARGKTFRWPDGPGVDGATVDLRPAMRERVSGDFTTQQFRKSLDWAWVTACNPRLETLFGCVFRRADYPWIGIWEENRDRRNQPWEGVTYCRGLEFGVSPRPMTRREAVDLGTLRGDPCYRWLGARETAQVDYAVFVADVDRGCAGVRGIDCVGDPPRSLQVSTSGEDAGSVPVRL